LLVAADVAAADPDGFVAVTVARRRYPTSVDVKTYVLAVASGMDWHEPVVVPVHLSHWYA
jgi:hypothetical protein